MMLRTRTIPIYILSKKKKKKKKKKKMMMNTTPYHSAIHL